MRELTIRIPDEVAHLLEIKAAKHDMRLGECIEELCKDIFDKWQN